MEWTSKPAGAAAQVDTRTSFYGLASAASIGANVGTMSSLKMRPLQIAHACVLRVVPLLCCLGGARAQSAQFIPIAGTSATPGSNGNGCYVNSQPRLSADGGTVGFTSYRGGVSTGAVPYDYAIWTQNGGTEVIAPSTSYGENFGWGIWGLSGDGTLACGSNWIWRRVGGYQSLDSTLNAQFPSVGYSVLFGCSQDGSVLAGWREGTVGIPAGGGDYFRWQLPQGAPQLLPRDAQHPEGYFTFNCVSGDGSVVGGQTYRSDATYGQTYAAALVTPAGTTLLTPESAGNATILRDLSFNGGVAVGQVSPGSPLGGFALESFRWSAANGLEVLPTPGTTSAAHACDSSGNTVVGAYLSFGTAGTRAYVWRAGSGATDLQVELTNTYGLGSALQGWTLLSATDVSADGSVIVGQGVNPSGCEQVFLVRLPPDPSTPTTLCAGDGSAGTTPCPCGNSGATGNGCANSVNPSGARLAAIGQARLAAPSLQLFGSGMPNATVLYFQGTAVLSGGAGVAFGDGLRCAGGTVVRLRTRQNSGGGSIVPAANEPTLAVLGSIPANGGTRLYQAWYRNSATYCTPASFNLTNAVSATWTP